ncbi:MAG: hypothetical protein JSV88_09020 [Candidatus Aminicenantes bacterium]|nr:MAG: hypothetical protein JSV88_09020 [Candidatus Aminicenantes bacterium]
MKSQFNNLLGWVFLIILPCIAAPVNVNGQNPKEFDKNQDNQLDKKELRVFLMHKFPPGFTEIDEDKNGKIDEEEIKNYTDPFIWDIEEKLGDKQYYTFEEIQQFYPEKPQFDFFGIRIRESYQEITFAEKEKSFDNAKPALFSYSRDFKNKADIWLAKGTIMRPIQLYTPRRDSRGNFYFSAFGLVPGISFHKLSQPGQGVDSLEFRLGVNFEFSGGIFDLQNIKIFGVYATDFRFESKIIAAQFQWEPVPLKLGFGVLKPLIPKILKYRLGFNTNFEYGHVIASGGNAELKDKETFIRLGFRLQVDVKIPPLKYLELAGKFDYFYGIQGSPGSSHLLTLKLIYLLNEKGNYSFQVDYSHGELHFTQGDIHHITFGIGIKY